jgi:hypothetical protein
MELSKALALQLMTVTKPASSKRHELSRCFCIVSLYGLAQLLAKAEICPAVSAAK